MSWPPDPFEVDLELRLRPLTVGDEPLLRAIRTDSQLCKYVNPPLAPDEANRAARRLIEEGGSGYFVIERPPQTEGLGFVSLVETDEAPDALELEVFVVVGEQGKRVGRRAARAVIQWAREHSDAKRVLARVDRENCVAVRLIKSLGMKYVYWGTPSWSIAEMYELTL
jgi:RimJ/RimL family protein N-acetyltransferase